MQKNLAAVRFEVSSEVRAIRDTTDRDLKADAASVALSVESAESRATDARSKSCSPSCRQPPRKRYKRRIVHSAKSAHRSHWQRARCPPASSAHATVRSRKVQPQEAERGSRKGAKAQRKVFFLTAQSNVCLL